MQSIGAFAADFSDVIAAWPMSFSSVHFLLFLPLCVGGYFALRGAGRRAWLLACSYWFYFFAAPKYLPVLLCGTALSYIFAQLISGRKTQRSRRAVCVLSVSLLLLNLIFFKYNGFFAPALEPLFASFGINYAQDFFVAASALGISFYTFTSVGYLIDVYRQDTPAEKNLLNHALFLGFFPSVSMGPISRASTLLPQLKEDRHKANPEDIKAGLRRMAVGYFKKLAVADTLAVFTGGIYGELAAYEGLTLSLAAVCFALQLYFDFSGYSDMAIGTARMLGVTLPENFKNPYFATNFSAFWQRWHISLSTWLQDYIFTPLVWSRWAERLPIIGRRIQKPPVLFAIATTFLVSGIWHGDTLCFLVWGALQAMFRIGEEICHRTLGKPKKRPPFRLRFGKTALVLFLWVESLVFFKVGMGPVAPGATQAGGVGDALSALVRQFSGISLSQTAQDVTSAVAGGFFNNPLMVFAFIAFSLMCVCVAVFADWAECFKLKGGHISDAIAAQKAPLRYAAYYFLVMCCFAAFLAQSGGFAGANFIYGGF